MWIFGLILLAIAAGLFYGHRSKLKKQGRIVSTETCTVEHLKELASSMADGLGSGSLRLPAGVQGRAECSVPLISELAETPSVHYSMSVRREYEEERTDGDGKSKTQRSSTQVASNKRSVPFYLEDATGSIWVEPSSARFVSDNALSRFLSPSAGDDPKLQVGGFTLNHSAPPTSGQKNLGYRFEEEVIPVGGEIFVLGEVTDAHGELRIEVPEGDEELLISVKSRSELIKELGSGAKGMKTAAIVIGILGLILLIL